MQDPTADEMREFLKPLEARYECDEFEAEEAIYWFAYHNHSGQASNLYEALCNSPYNPGPYVTGVSA